MELTTGLITPNPHDFDTCCLASEVQSSLPFPQLAELSHTIISDRSHRQSFLNLADREDMCVRPSVCQPPGRSSSRLPHADEGKNSELLTDVFAGSIRGLRSAPPRGVAREWELRVMKG